MRHVLRRLTGGMSRTRSGWAGRLLRARLLNRRGADLDRIERPDQQYSANHPSQRNDLGAVMIRILLTVALLALAPLPASAQAVLRIDTPMSPPASCRPPAHLLLYAEAAPCDTMAQ